MKRSSFKRVIALGLSFCMCLSLAACSKGNEDGGKTSTKSNNKADKNLSKMYVYKEEPIDFVSSKDENTYMSLNTMEICGDEVYVIYSMSSEKISNAYYLTKVNSETKKADTVVLEGTLNQQTDNEIDETDVKIETAYAEAPPEDLDVEAEASETEVSEATEDLTAYDDAGTEGASASFDYSSSVPLDSDVYSDDYSDDYVEPYSEFSQFAVMQDGKVCGLSVSYGDRGYNDDGSASTDYYIYVWENDGKLVNSFLLEDVSPDEGYNYVAGFNAFENNTLKLAFAGDVPEIITINTDGSFDKKEINSENRSFGDVSNSFVIDENTLGCIGYDYENDYGKVLYFEYDFTTDKFGEVKELPDYLYYAGIYSVNRGKEHDCVFSDDKGVFAFNIGDTECTKLMDYTNSDLPVYSLNDFAVIDENHFFGIYYGDNSDLCLSYFEYVDPKDLPDKKEIVAAGCYLDSDFRKKVIQFNKNSEEYRIVTKTYEEYDSNEGAVSGTEKLNKEIAAGEMPDILVNYRYSSNLPIESYAKKGLFADVEELIKNDPELSGYEFMDNVFDAYRIKGKLYAVIPSFSVQTYVGKKSIFNKDSLSFDEFLEYSKNLPEGGQMMEDMTRDSFLTNFYQFNKVNYVDEYEKKCSFDTDEFKKALEYAKTLPDEIDWSNRDEQYYDEQSAAYRNEKTLLCYAGLYGIADMNWIQGGSFGEEVAYTGFPCDSGNGSAISADVCYYLSNENGNVDGAWNFIKQFLKEDYQKENVWALPMLKNLLRDQIVKATEKPYYIDDNGEKVETPYSYFIGNEEVQYDPMSKEDAQKVFDFICSVNKKMADTDDLYEIITEEAQAYFADQKSVDDVVNVIQNRAQLFLNERID
ncbi:MAG: hypothetical protein K6F84_04530 [Lachnospiraceae bacterium]|nr:hypothetical protein [Lachnospiraceae bacterium]